jgi:kynurenine 3-monooxygenase
MTGASQVGIVGGGLAGSLLGILCARRGLRPIIVERDASFDEPATAHGRSINLALAARGIEALRYAGVLAEIEPLLLPMAGRKVHQDGTERFLPYGQRRDERIYSVARAGLGRRLFEIARDRFGVEYRFRHECAGMTAAGTAQIRSPQDVYELKTSFLVGADGAGSAVRRALEAAGAVRATEDMLDHGYKELTLAATPAGEFALAPEALHIWPRGNFMLIALPNVDRTFTATLFLALKGRPSFASVGADVRSFFVAHFADALPLIPKLESEYNAHPVGRLGTLTCAPWSHLGRVLLIGDAAHAIVPFHGQGMNAAFEDCVELDRLLGEHGSDWARICAEFERRRTGNAAAIAAMALENYREMRDDVRNPKFRLKTEVAFELERRHAEFIPRYAMVMFHPEISYAEARRRGAVQAEILELLTQNARALDDVDFKRAAELIDERLGGRSYPQNPSVEV